MNFNPHNAMRLAQEYIGSNQPLTRLGWGVSGFVFLSPDLRTAIKVHHHEHIPFTTRC